ncbi:MAG: FISUMP domain-containing protein [Patescibacteria group bacterium]|nr:FISUMP domain-containing protein [Patescibacteria group bacterium]
MNIQKTKELFLNNKKILLLVLGGVLIFFILILFLILSTPEAKPPFDLRAEARDYDKVNLTWLDESDGEEYNVYRSLSLKEDYEKIETVEDRHYLDWDIEPETNYYYKVTSVKKEKESGFSSVVQVFTENVGEVRNLTVKEAGSSYVNLSWEGFRDSNGYIIYRTEDVNKPYSRIGSTNNTYYIDTELESDKTYYYAVSQIVNGKESDYSNQHLEIKTEYYWFCGYAVSYQGELYNTVNIGEQCWFSSNLNYPTATGSWCYGNDIENCFLYGRLYNFETAVNGDEDICPEGWRVPTDNDFVKLEEEMGVSEVEVVNQGWRGEERGIGDKLKTEDYCSQTNNRFCGTVDLDVKMGGIREEDGEFLYFGTRSFFWTSNSDQDFGWIRGFGREKAGIYRGLENKEAGFFIRCIKS